MGVWIETFCLRSDCDTHAVTPYVGVWIETRINCLIPCFGIVTPYVGVWIETTYLLPYSVNIKSHPTWVCGLKLYLVIQNKKEPAVTPYVGVWIETSMIAFICVLVFVTPYVGVWIETITYSCDNRRRKSHPTWVCGLKLFEVLDELTSVQSHPTWVCGLKHTIV